ncbi:hypothetical protein KR093_009705 [Drosophila rubida]|uniref:Titin n=1 Tax=Drosophila rubida TaxID=30044 RepID=A0AAD4PLW8_9MUSC|nr:hypothetical protein KR093_009705 [Drosophila rubida]
MSKKPRSSLKKVVIDEGDAPIRPVSRRISFSGKKFIREFDTTEKPRDYDNSYEISEHTNGDDSSGQSHVTVAAVSTLHLEKENKSITIRESICTQYDQQQHSDFTLQLQSSVNLTLMPHELSKNRQQRQRMDLTAPMEFDSLSLSDVEREKLRENSMFRVPLSEKTMDLMPHKMLFEELECKQPAKADQQKTISKDMDMTCEAEKENIMQQKTMLFEDNNITCDFSDIDPHQAVAAPPNINVVATPKQESFDMEDRDCMNYLPDESTSSPLIPLDVINENNISRKLNFRQLMDALNAGRIQLFPNGPRTPTTDKSAKPPRFWHGLEQQPEQQQDLPLREVIKPRSTLNFSESMMMSPPAQQPNMATKNHLEDPFAGKKEGQAKCNNRFSQADEFMLDNTNFLVHAKIGDETQSRNSSKSASRRETTYDNTAMELDDLEKHEAAVVAALEKATRRPQLQRCTDTDGNDTQAKGKLSRTMQLNESIEVDHEPEQMGQAMEMDTSMLEPPTTAVEQEYVIRRQTMHFATAIDEDQSSPQRDLPRAPRRQTLHFAEDMDEDMPSPRQEKPMPIKQHHSKTLIMVEPIDEETKLQPAAVATATEVQSNRRQQTVLFAEDIDEDPSSPRKATATQQSTHGRRQTLHVTEPIKEDIENVAPIVVQEYNIRRQTLHFVEAIDEDPSSPLKDFQTNSAAASLQKQTNRHRQTLLMAEPIEEDLMETQKASELQKEPQRSQHLVPAVKRATSQGKQSVCFAEAIDIEMPSPTMDSRSKSRAVPQAQQTSRRRGTLLMSEAIEEDELRPQQSTAAINRPKERRQTLHTVEAMEEEPMKAQPNASIAGPLVQQTSRRRETLVMSEAIEEDELRPQQATASMEDLKERRRQKLHTAEAMEEEPMKAHPSASIAAPLVHQTSRRRETLLMVEAIEEDELRPQLAAGALEDLKERKRQTLHTAEAIEEEPMKAQPKASLAAPQTSRRRETLLMAEAIEEDELKPQLAAGPLEDLKGRRRQTLHTAEAMEEEPMKAQPSASLSARLTQQTSHRRETLLMAEPIEEELKPQVATAEVEHQSNSRRQTLHLAEPIEEEPTKIQPITTKELPSKCRPSPLQYASSRRRQTLLMAEPIEEEAMQPAAAKTERPSCQPGRRQTLHMAEPIEEDLMPSTATSRDKPSAYVSESISVDPNTNLLAAPLEQKSRRNRQTMHMAEPIEEDTVKVPTDLRAMPAPPSVRTHLIRRQTLHFEEDIEVDIQRPQQELPVVATPMDPQSNRGRQTMHMSEAIQEDFMVPKDPAPSAVRTHSIRRQTLHYEEAIEEDIQPTQCGVQLSAIAAPVEQKSNRRRQTMHMAEPIEEDSFSVDMETVPSQAAAPVEYREKMRQTLHMREAIDEEPAASSKQTHTLLPTERVEEDPKSHKLENQLKTKPPLYLADAIETDICQQQSATMRQETIEIDDSCIEIASTYPAVSKPHQTLHMTVDMDDDDVPTAAVLEHDGKKPRMTFLENMDPEYLSPIAESAGRESPSDSAEWLAQMNAKMRKTLVNPGKAKPEASVETPKNKKMLHRSCFPITPGRSIIEYEDLEVMCNVDSSEVAATAAAPTAQQPVVDMHMDTSSCGTPVAAFKIKRLPIHLTPNLPQPKKRNTQHSVIEKDQNNSQEQLNASGAEEVATPTVDKNKSRIPVLCKSFNSPWQETDQLDGTVQMVRAQMMRQTRSLFGVETMSPLEQNLKAPTTVTYEDNPITISDVSSHFAAQKELAKLVAKNTSSSSRSSNENSNKSYARAHKKFLNLSGDTEIFDAAEVIELSLDDNEIEKTRLSLVSTLIDEEEASLVDGTGVELEPEPEPEPQTEPEACLEQVNPPVAAGAVDACKKCTHCRRSLNMTLANETEAFELPNWNALELGLERLKRLRQHPTLDEVHRYWELKDLERYSNGSDNLSETSEDMHEQRTTLQDLLSNFKHKFEELKKKLPEPEIVESYAKRLHVALREQLPRWIFDCELQCDRQYIITHKAISTFRLVINYEPLDIMETEIRVRSIKATTFYNKIPKSRWGVLAHLMDFQLRLGLPLNLMILLDGNKVDDVVKFLNHIDSICMNTKKLCNNLRLMLISRQALLVRQPNRTVVRKTVRQMSRAKDEAHSRFEKINFLIEVSNVEKLSFENILQPPLYQFDEKIQFLPKGIAFLDAFLEHPEQYLKPIVQPTN